MSTTEQAFFKIDASISGYDTDIWIATAGTPTATGGVVRLTEDGMIHAGDIVKGSIKMSINVPTAPAEGDVRQWGFSFPAKGAYAYFDITDDTFSVKCADGNGDTDSEELTWDDTNWSAENVVFEIIWEPGAYIFKVGDTVKARLDSAITQSPMSIYLNNGTDDNMDINYVEVQAAKYTI